MLIVQNPWYAADLTPCCFDTSGITGTAGIYRNFVFRASFRKCQEIQKIIVHGYKEGRIRSCMSLWLGHGCSVLRLG